ncbi:MAG: hypothetical protein HXY34_01100 [Candidatus Thorarchaeota archaeon]|nr:hypothetical protein [Candidatus Thorarchaeota archaeon]
MSTLERNNESTFLEPRVTESALATLPDCLRRVLLEARKDGLPGRKSILVSSNALANRFVYERWGIRPSQRRRFRTLFATTRKQCRALFQYLLARGRFQWDSAREGHVFGVFKFDEIRGNLILGFVRGSSSLDWTVPSD